MKDIHETSLRLAGEWLDNTSDNDFIEQYNDIVKSQNKKLTEFDVFEALDRTSTIVKMINELIGSVGEEDDPDFLVDVHPAIKKHYKLLSAAQDNLCELYQKLGQDFFDYGGSSNVTE